VPGLFFSAEARERQRGWALDGASRVAKGMPGGGSKCPKQSSAFTQASIKKGRFLLQLFFLKEKLRTGSLHIIKKPVEMNRPAMKLTSPKDVWAGARGCCFVLFRSLPVPTLRDWCNLLTQYQFRSLGTGAFLLRDSAPKNSDLVKEGVSFGRCQTHRRLPNDLADGQSGYKQPLKEDSARLNQACKKEVSFATFLSKKKVENRFTAHHQKAC